MPVLPWNIYETEEKRLYETEEKRLAVDIIDSTGRIVAWEVLRADAEFIIEKVNKGMKAEDSPNSTRKED